MAKNGNIIELNGKRYDALTGQMLGASSHGRSVDGVVAPAGHVAKPTVKPTLPQHHAAGPPIKTIKNPVMDISRPSSRKLAHHAPKKSQTLMRSAVHKPVPSLKRSSKTVSDTTAVLQQPKFEIVKKLSHPTVDTKRAQRSSRVARSDYIRRFATPEVDRPAPKPAMTTARPVRTAAVTPAVHAVSAPTPAPAPTVSSMDVFERALQRANSHMELPPVQPRGRAKRQRKTGSGRRALSIGATSLAVLLIAGFIAYQNQANLTIKYASTKAGFAASLPGYKPAGFAVGKFSYSAGQVGVIYTNSTSGQTFSLQQQKSGWDSDALRENFVAVQGTSYHSVDSAGRTIYTYGNNNATWVNGGVWYNVTTAGSLTTNELVSLATSI